MRERDRHTHIQGEAAAGDDGIRERRVREGGGYRQVPHCKFHSAACVGASANHSELLTMFHRERQIIVSWCPLSANHSELVPS